MLKININNNSEKNRDYKQILTTQFDGKIYIIFKRKTCTLICYLWNGGKWYKMFIYTFNFQKKCSGNNSSPVTAGGLGSES